MFSTLQVNPLLPKPNRSQLKERIEEAIQRGCTAVLCEDSDLCRELANEHPHLLILVPPLDPSPDLPFQIIREFYAGVPPFLAAVTGTNGKTSTVNFARQILGRLGKKSASLGTLGVSIENCPEIKMEAIPTSSRTTPDPTTLHKCLDILATSAGVEYLSLEASSHGLIQQRLHGLRFHVGVFTNLTQDHLDYHGSMEAYFEAKLILFSQLIIPNGVALLTNKLSTKELEKLRRICTERNIRIWEYGENDGNINFRVNPGSKEKVLSFGGKEIALPPNLQQWPAFQLENILAAIGIVLSFEKFGSGIGLEEVMEALTELEGVPGRFEFVGVTRSGGSVFVDFAHTPDALESILKSFPVKIDRTWKLHLVFGCGGNRDSGKRKDMGRIASKYADHVIVTDDNPREEDPASIRAQILEGIHAQMRGKGNVEDIGERRQAILRGIQALGKGDVLMITGKGAETVQIYGDKQVPFSDSQVVQEVLSSLN
jgi:UDP-N-acetylmuramoyl-L-alanyl-D-glutamate--2,6-diaminopimelate ligase